jgi:hypothetical protein
VENARPAVTSLRTNELQKLRGAGKQPKTAKKWPETAIFSQISAVFSQNQPFFRRRVSTRSAAHQAMGTGREFPVRSFSVASTCKLL